MNLNELKEGVKALSVAEIRDLISFAEDVKRVKIAAEKATEKELAEERAALTPADYAVGEAIKVKYYSDWLDGIVTKVNGKSVKVKFTKKDRKTGVVSETEDLKATDKIRKLTAAEKAAKAAKAAEAAEAAIAAEAVA